MKHWQETAEILSQLTAEALSGRRAAIATVVGIKGSAYRRPGAKLLVKESGGTTGGISGGCLEADVRERALIALKSGSPRLLHYETGSDDRSAFGLGLGCNGSVDVFVQAATTPEFLESARRAARALEGEDPFATSTVLEGPSAGEVLLLGPDGTLLPPGEAQHHGLAVDAAELLRRSETAVHEVGSPAEKVFTEVFLPPPHLVLFGAGDDAVPLARYAREAGFRVTLVDHRPAFLSAAQSTARVRGLELRPEGAADPLPLGRGTYAVVKTHSLEYDREWIRRLLATEVSYIGVLGPRARVEEILRQLGAAADERVFGPVGLDLGADGPEQVAMSIVAEMLAVRSGRAPDHLRRRRGSIHAS